MPNKVSNVYVCGNCDAQFPKWSGRCLTCGAWGTLTLQTVEQPAGGGSIKIAPASLIKMSDIPDGSFIRLKTGLGEFDRVLGGGLVPGSITLISGEPGIGKSTLIAQLADNLARSKSGEVVYISGEESVMQIKERLLRLGCQAANISFIADTNAEKIIAALKARQPILALVDSIQTMYSSQVPAEPGSISQIRACTVNFLELAKTTGLPVILVGHITKDGQIAGPKSLEHIVDTVIYLESDPARDFRILRATKNRFGSVNEIGIFEMTGTGFREVKNPAGIFIESGRENISGSAISAVMEGTRPFLVEVQALVTKTVFGYPQRKASGFDLNRLQVLCAVLTKRGQINLLNQDVIVNIVGGFKFAETGLDLAVCFAIASSMLNQTLDQGTVIIGEVGLGGEVRNVAKLKDRLSEAANLGIKKAIIPDVNISIGKLDLIRIKNIGEVVKLIMDKL